MGTLNRWCVMQRKMPWHTSSTSVHTYRNTHTSIHLHAYMFKAHTYILLHGIYGALFIVRIILNVIQVAATSVKYRLHILVVLRLTSSYLQYFWSHIYVRIASFGNGLEHFSTPGVNFHPNMAHTLCVSEAIKDWNMRPITLNNPPAQQRQNIQNDVTRHAF